jgi:hypothetical protein
MKSIFNRTEHEEGAKKTQRDPLIFAFSLRKTLRSLRLTYSLQKPIYPHKQT